MKKFSVLDMQADHLFECDLKKECAPLFDSYHTNTEIINFLEEKGVIRGDFTQKRYLPDDTGIFALHFNSESAANSFIERFNNFLEN